MNTISSKKEFSKIVDRERVRSDRTGREFSLIVFEVSGSKDSQSLLYYLSYILDQRVRCYDQIGRLDKSRLGVLLPETTHEGAHKLAADICSSIIPKALHPIYTIITYPSQWKNLYEDEPPQADRPDAHSDDTGSAEQTIAKSSQSTMSILQEIEMLLPGRTPLWKRFMDIVFSVTGLIVCSPFFLLMTMFIKIVSPGPVFFKQKRVGYRGKPFTCFKFRTMKSDANTSVHSQHFKNLISNGDPLKKLDHKDDRIIPFGVLMRKTGLDELPQLFNVVRGEMSLIGPRPCIPYEAREYRNWQHRRFDSVPGLTGLWQVSGKNRTTFNEMMRYDISYAHKKSLWLDVKILFKTLPAIITQVNE